ncbi:hypothetical protein P886_0246 [Alteromonadaceae bacterium 2753L.S.0a.02]|nr:hypothetical protein P886_0246 [Alteromonadaceae bacterium 2753L.S.0a.02]
MSKRNKPRNFHACHPIMKKGGVHEKSRSAKRAAAKQETRRKVSDWLGRSTLFLACLIYNRIV